MSEASDFFVGGYALTPHPQKPARAVEHVSFTIIWKGAGQWVFEFSTTASPATLALPAPAEPARADGLWKTTCFELFLLDPDDGSYLEFNFSPSGQWAAYRFDSYREGMRPLEVQRPCIFSSNPVQAAMSMKARFRSYGMPEQSVEQFAAGLANLPTAPHFNLRVELEDPALRNDSPWLAGVSAVIEEADGTKSYWALAHPGDEPDFHDEAGFVLELPASPDAHD